jgi:NADPH-dependent glutamate synthase beta subunit-like oxidoreductase/ferredoxin
MTGGKFYVEVADVAYWQKQIKCQWGCPVRTDSRGYVIAIAEGRYLDAYRIARGPNPFASICGRVCGAPCEVACRRGDIDESVSIRALKRFVTEKHGVEAGDPVSTVEFSTARRDPDNPVKGTKVAVIGAGVAGMTAAHDLALLGYRVSVFESESVAGGMLVTGVPPYRLPRDLVQAEIDAILGLGVDLHLNTSIGEDVTISELREQGFKSILIAAGLQNSRKIPLEGGDLKGVVHGIEFLKDVNLGRQVEIGERIVVIGGGSVAFDVARSALREPKPSGKADIEDFYEAADVARVALRAGAREIHLVCLESRDEMPADEMEIEEGLDEGVQLHASRGPLGILGENGKVTGLSTRIVKSVFDKDGRFSPQFADEPGEVIDADTVILAVGQTADFGFLKDSDDVKLSRRGIVEVDPETKMTNVPDVFACGDVADGAGLFINAVASGQRAAVSIDEFLRDKTLTTSIEGTFELPVLHEMSSRYIQLERVDPSVVQASRRVQSNEAVELPYEETVACEQGERCLHCHIDTIFHGDLCILCNGCVDVCPTYCLALVPLSEIAVSPKLQQLFAERYGPAVYEILERNDQQSLAEMGSAMLKDEELCIRCGFCADRCPTGAVTMEHFYYEQSFGWQKREAGKTL